MIKNEFVKKTTTHIPILVLTQNVPDKDFDQVLNITVKNVVVSTRY